MKCRKCSEDIELHYGNGFNNKLKELEICFNCDFWYEKVENVNHINSLRIEREHYWIGEEKTNSGLGFRGFGGRKFKIKKGDKIITTTNLWHQGKIPEHFKELLPDNAEFIIKDMEK